MKKKNLKLLTNEQQKSCHNLKFCYICKENFEDKHATDKLRGHCHYTGEYSADAHDIFDLKYSIPKKNSYSFPQWI